MTGLLTSLLGNTKKENNFLKVENGIKLESGKNIYVLTAGREKFLVSVSSQGCQFLTKLEEGNMPVSFSKNTVCHSEAKSGKNLLNSGIRQTDKSFSSLRFAQNDNLGLNINYDNPKTTENSDYIGLKKLLR